MHFPVTPLMSPGFEEIAGYLYQVTHVSGLVIQVFIRKLWKVSGGFQAIDDKRNECSPRRFDNDYKILFHSLIILLCLDAIGFANFSSDSHQLPSELRLLCAQF